MPLNKELPIKKSQPTRDAITVSSVYVVKEMKRNKSRPLQ